MSATSQAPTNLDIAQQATLRDIRDIAGEAGLGKEDYEPLGYHKAKLTTEKVRSLATSAKTGKLILVTAVSPTPAGEGKTTVVVGLTQGLRRLEHSAICSLREPALGPIFGIKGGACGGGYSQVLPMEDINLFFTGDFPAITAAHNLLSALLDAHLHNGNELGIDPRVEMWPRTIDMNDRALRHVVVGLGGRNNGYAREDGFVITPASEIMAILCLSESLEDLKERLGSIVVGVTHKKLPIFARDLQAHGAMTALLRTAIRPNLVQTMEGGAALVHGGPFGNIAHGCSSLVATRSALGLADYTITEAGFGSDLGAEKFLNIVCPRLGRGPDAIVLVATVRSAMHHGDGSLEAGAANLLRHIRHLRHYGPPIVVAVNRRAEDTDDEIQRLIDLCEAEGVRAVAADPWNGGGAGCEALGRAVVELADEPSTFKPLYQSGDNAVDKLQAIVSKAYGGAEVELSDIAKRHLAWAEKHGFGGFSICVAKTQYSLSDDPERLNAPEGFTVHVRDIHISAGSRFLVAMCGEIMLMPGLGKSPAAFRIDVDADGQITGLF
ncbi:MAG: formate--tetrahydrofolate ligase [Fimbriimonadaceae bacterium]|nr:formate--tetrahydrofolate ligase [Fimbriimonadaceae bacterium]